MDLEFEWDEDKRRTNREKHGVDFVRVQQIFDGRPTYTRASRYAAEPRSVTIGQLDDANFYFVVWTLRGTAIRFISARRANRAEVREYRAIHGE